MGRVSPHGMEDFKCEKGVIGGFDSVGNAFGDDFNDHIPDANRSVLEWNGGDMHLGMSDLHMVEVFWGRAVIENVKDGLKHIKLYDWLEFGEKMTEKPSDPSALRGCIFSGLDNRLH